MPQKPSYCTSNLLSAYSVQYSTATAKTQDETYLANLKLISDFNLLRYLENHEPLNFELYKVKLRKALRLTLTEFKVIYNAYKSMRGAV